MTINLNARMGEQAAFIQASSAVALASTAGSGVWVSLKGYRKCTVILNVLNATTVTGGTITLEQATAVAGTSAKALAFTRMLANIDVVASQTLVETAVASNTFTTDSTNSKQLMYVIEVDSDSLDVANSFDCFHVKSASMSAAIGQLTYILWGARYSGFDPTVN